MNKILIRKAETNDMVSVLGLIKELAEFEREPNSVSINVDDLINDGFCNNPKFRCLVACSSNNDIIIPWNCEKDSTVCCVRDHDRMVTSQKRFV